MKLRFPLSPPRAEDGTLLPAALLALLAGAAALQLLFARDSSLPGEGVGRVAPALAGVEVRHRDVPPVILARPLFSPTRSMEARPITLADTAAVGPLEGAVPVGMIARGRAARLFLRLADGSVRTLGIGSTYLGWRLTGLSASGATFARGGEKISIDYGSAAPASASGGENTEDEETEDE